MDKSLLLFSDKNCEHCQEAKETAEKVAQELNIPLTTYPVQELGENTDIPVTCVIDKNKKEHACFVGYKPEEYEPRLRKLLTES